MYPACKFALTALTECLRQEVSYIEMGVRVTVRIGILSPLFLLFTLYDSFNSKFPLNLRDDARIIIVKLSLINF